MLPSSTAAVDFAAVVIDAVVFILVWCAVVAGNELNLS